MRIHTVRRPSRLLKKSEKTPESVIPAQAGIQHITDFVGSNILDPDRKSTRLNSSHQ